MSEEMKLLIALCDALGFEVRAKYYVNGNEIPSGEIYEYETKRDYFVKFIGGPY